MGKTRKFQFVWPKDGPKGKSGKQGFFGRLDNILTSRGPDVFLQRKGSSRPIEPEWWGNWDSWSDPLCHYLEQTASYKNGLWDASRGFQRYDPQSRRYTEWTYPQDWDGIRAYQRLYPRFTQDEWTKMAQTLRRGGRVHPLRMGKDWHHDGPRRFEYEHDWFWQNAHRLGENFREGLSPYHGTNPHFTMHQNWSGDLRNWLQGEGLLH